jgi:hypothetical protein
VHAGERGDEQELRDEVPVCDRVHRVGRRGREAQLLGHHHRVERQRRTGQRARAQGRDGRAPVPVAEPVEVAQQRLHVCQQPVPERDRLRVLHVGHARRRRVDVPGRLLHQRVGQLDQPAGDAAGVVAQV